MVYCSSSAARQLWLRLLALTIMANKGDVYSSHGKFFAKIEAQEEGIRFHMKGPHREDKQQATQDLTNIRAAASGRATRLDELLAMKQAELVMINITVNL